MSILFDKRTKSAIKWIWAAFAVMISISMIFAFSGGIGATGGGAPRAIQQASPQEEVVPAPVNIPAPASVPEDSGPQIDFSIDI